MSHVSHVTKMAEIVTLFSELVRHRISTREWVKVWNFCCSTTPYQSIFVSQVKVTRAPTASAQQSKIVISVPNPRGPLKSLFCSAVQAVGARVTFTWLKDTLVGCGTAAEVSDLNSLSCGNPVPNQFWKPGYYFGHFCHVTDRWHFISVI